MSQVRCARCGQEAEALARAPLPGEVGESVLERVCRECWSSWLGEQVKIINENQLSPADPAAFEFLVARMKAYLSIG
jgi:Fe-S cluster biosynthesis and repair protein YggX